MVDYNLAIIFIGLLWLLVVCLAVVNFYLNQHCFNKHLTNLQIETTKLRSDLDKVITTQSQLQIELNLTLFKIKMKENADADNGTKT